MERNRFVSHVHRKRPKGRQRLVESCLIGRKAIIPNCGRACFIDHFKRPVGRLKPIDGGYYPAYLKGWARFMYEDKLTLVEVGDCVHQRPGIVHYLFETWNIWRSPDQPTLARRKCLVYAKHQRRRLLDLTRCENRGSLPRVDASEYKQRVHAIDSEAVGMQELSSEGRKIVDDLTRRHGVGSDAVTALICALERGNGAQAQFNHPDLGGMGQWSQGCMIMIGEMFKSRPQTPRRRALPRDRQPPALSTVALPARCGPYSIAGSKRRLRRGQSDCTASFRPSTSTSRIASRTRSAWSSRSNFLRRARSAFTLVIVHHRFGNPFHLAHRYGQHVSPVQYNPRLQ